MKLKTLVVLAFLSHKLYSQSVEIEDWKIRALKIASYTESKIIYNDTSSNDTCLVSKCFFNDSCLLIERQYDFRKKSLKSEELEYTSDFYFYDKRGNLKSIVIQNYFEKIIDGVYLKGNSECKTFDKSGNIVSIVFSFANGQTSSVHYIYSEFILSNSELAIQLPTKIEHFRNGKLEHINIIEYEFINEK